MPTPPPIGPLAHMALAELAIALRSPGAGDIERWVLRHAHHARRREVQIVSALAVTVGDRRAASVAAPPDEVWRPDVSADATSAELLAARMIAAYLNDDPATVTALALAWAGWDPAARAAALHVFVRLVASG
ncbi:hypothetical protein [Microbacterium thalli]|uniref:Uncharacterized protein n=1 Tax=Microbacterium thalli TaxID=3027921 RepID=A0ABT5SL09_9MICO|nr:hypothetical protein [Microbacterium thalli]MDD7928002.1 hypothetical protein [Microbacterium thalli]MDD7963155.1 hypothetical protein [Microbacterium thalli]MDN8548147.1 hypothetical protein [Microbacterium thalli]